MHQTEIHLDPARTALVVIDMQIAFLKTRSTFQSAGGAGDRAQHRDTRCGRSWTSAPRQRFLCHGFISISTTGLKRSGCYATSEQIAQVSGDDIVLSVAFAPR